MPNFNQNYIDGIKKIRYMNYRLNAYKAITTKDSEFKFYSYSLTAVDSNGVHEVSLKNLGIEIDSIEECQENFLIQNFLDAIKKYNPIGYEVWLPQYKANKQNDLPS